LRINQLRPGQPPQPILNRQLTDLDTICVNGVCSFDLANSGVVLEAGVTYRWWVVARTGRNVSTPRRIFEITADAMAQPTAGPTLDPGEASTQPTAVPDLARPAGNTQYHFVDNVDSLRTLVEGGANVQTADTYVIFLKEGTYTLTNRIMVVGKVIIRGMDSTFSDDATVTFQPTAGSTGTFQLFFIVSGAEITFYNAVIRNGGGSSRAFGGAIGNGGRLNLYNSEMRNNTATVQGGAIYNTGTVELINARFFDNDAQLGGAIANIGGNILVKDQPGYRCAAFEANDASSKGGALYNQGGSPTLANSNFLNNTSGTPPRDIHNSSAANTVNATNSYWNPAPPSVDDGVQTSPTVGWASLGCTVPPAPEPPPTSCPAGSGNFDPASEDCPDDKPVSVKFEVEGRGTPIFGNPDNPQQITGWNEFPLIDGKIIPYADYVLLTLTITNQSTEPLTGTLDFRNIITAPGPNYVEDPVNEQIIPVRVTDSNGGVCCGVPPEPDLPRLRYTISTAIQPGTSVTYRPVFQARRSGLLELPYTFTSTALPEPVTGNVEVMTADVTRLDFNGADAPLRAAMFWAIYNETSEGTFLNYMPSGSPCKEAGWDFGPNRIAITGLVRIFDVIRYADSNTPGCRDVEYLDAQTMLNGVLNYERDPKGDHPFLYFTSNYAGSLGNQPYCPPDEDPRGCDGFFFGDGPGDPDFGSYELWMSDNLWPLGTTIGMQQTGKVSYKIALADNPQSAARWLAAYLQSYMAFVAPLDARQQHLRSFYEQVYLNSNNVIDQVIADFQAGCPQSIADANAYRNCDPTNGAVGRKGGNAQGETASYEVAIPNCSGADPAQILATVDVLTAFNQHMQLMGSPTYNGTPINGYIPDHASILMPAVWFIRQGSNYQVVDCIWTSVVYQRIPSPYNYPR
jgi:predicted outer membrane repeat protein